MKRNSTTEQTQLNQRLARIARLGATLAVVTIAFGCAVSAFAQDTFAQFDETQGNEPFTFTNNGTSATFSGTAMGNFTFLLPGLPNTPQAVIITLSSTTFTQAETGGPLILQPIDGSTNTLSFTRVSDGANLLTVTFTGSILGFAGDNSATMSGNTAMGDTVTFTSDFLNFSGTTERDMSVDLSLDPAYTQNADGFLDNFTADLDGGFTATPDPTVVPEPAVYMLLGVGMLVCCQRFFRRGNS